MSYKLQAPTYECTLDSYKIQLLMINRRVIWSVRNSSTKNVIFYYFFLFYLITTRNDEKNVVNEWKVVLLNILHLLLISTNVVA